MVMPQTLNERRDGTSGEDVVLPRPYGHGEPKWLEHQCQTLADVVIDPSDLQPL